MKKGAYLGPKHEANPHEVYNEFIYTGYRINYTTWSVTLKSIFQFHNESVNVWTHFVGFVVGLISVIVVCCSQIGVQSYQVI